MISSYQAFYKQAMTLNNLLRLDNGPSCGLDISRIALHSAPTHIRGILLSVCWVAPE